MASEYGIVCENAFCACETVESEHVSVAGRRFCCIACAEDWARHNGALVEVHVSANRSEAGARPSDAPLGSVGDSLI
ncbi:hypothetical protein T281_10305 [Rhodomicrobium udaipurense JA643]|uniref:Uncharacterized protein n=1 Tax=Rhodomicrobium udaipurense TaxID=1202716 RepID=A0A8I1GFZ0_9HYPH|nr:hypothetical protein [Rhodomicrobium udaipurense]KAI94547.1 hypothetical protein T281_10305 [Rhodomicrobium udaipurense JA643]MBJ7544399.1 hypothetical protein [Rhodomicrobium udaipurense]